MAFALDTCAAWRYIRHVPTRFDIGVRIRAARKQRGWSQEKLAEVAGTSRRHVIKWERGDHIPNQTYRSILTTLLGVNFDDLEIDEAEEEMSVLLRRVEEIRARHGLGTAA